ncbi:vacuolar aspartyl aminopeptidase Lap4 [Metarhizium album ARSEF 1941]|uniref:Vacuolar aspartyl aminopeptidase Lap4 n=1 Tax=Metarhizium album (strain ARSEF 1941) TaxID=1081103 RepID=A0A0B2X7F5_METAS|nr:vacuolar aspartyl aminopeptidase Lap4 [Metarhizium album ARSEF 1941]KHO01435.1 vacuolar aspartyl aminopeptidase Lap4 [Metarhizium album ARSEF 1941]
MTRRTPVPYHQYSVLPLRQPPAAAPPSPSPAPVTTTPNSSLGSKNLVLADMDGRTCRENRACASCISRLMPSEIGQVNLADDQTCRLCRVARCEPEAFTKPFCDFLQENPTVFHTVHYFQRKLSDSGFKELSARDAWNGKIHPGGKYWVTRNGSTIIAFTVGEAYKPGNGAAMIGGHIDALTARLKPVSHRPNKAGYVQLGVAQYAGGLNHTWWDRDLSIGGRVVFRDPETGKTSTRLVKLDWPIAKIPTLAPHFGIGMFGNNNKETQAVPIIGLQGSSRQDAEPLGPDGAFVNTQPPRLVQLIAKELGISSYSSILDWELELYDSQPAQRMGMDKEFITAGRIDDKLCSWAALMGLLAADNNPTDGHIKLVALFDDEEIGSLLRQGARSNFLPIVIERTVEALNPSSYGPGLLGQTYARSFLLSADVTHAGNPNFLETYMDGHVPQLNVGIVICGDSNGHMTTDAVSTAILRRVGEMVGAKTQNFQIRNDSRSGGTIGPSLSSAMGCRAADAGLPQLSMHSVRATTGALDPGLGVQYFKGFLDLWEQIDGEWS